MSFPGCQCLKHLLIECGFDNVFTLKMISETHLSELENYINPIRQSLLNGLNCNHASNYMNQSIFKFLPGHRIILLNWPAQIQIDSNRTNEMFSVDHPAFSPVLRETIIYALKNYNKDPKNRQFSDLLSQFSIYMYILAGKASYEMISANFHLPKVPTICKCLI